MGPSGAAPILAFPEIMDRNNGVWTSINMFNSSTTHSANIKIEYHGRLENGTGAIVTKTQTLTLGPLESTNILHAKSSKAFAYELGDGWVGSALLYAVDDQGNLDRDAQLVAITNKLGPDQGGDALSAYNAFPLWEMPGTLD